MGFLALLHSAILAIEALVKDFSRCRCLSEPLIHPPSRVASCTLNTKRLSISSDSKISDPNFGSDTTCCSVCLNPSRSSRPASPASNTVDTTMDPQIQARLDSMQAVIKGLQGQLAAAAAAPAAGPPAAINILVNAGALAAALNAAKTKDHSKDLDHIAKFNAEGSLHADDFLKNMEGTFTLKATPEVDKVPLVIPHLSSKALVAFKAFTNSNGDTNNHHTMTFAELKQLLLSLLPNLLVKQDALEK
eukprot:1936588-Rhodomonas_salina.2